VKALSLWHPHAQAIALGLETWETGRWPDFAHAMPQMERGFGPQPDRGFNPAGAGSSRASRHSLAQHVLDFCQNLPGR